MNHHIGDVMSTDTEPNNPTARAISPTNFPENPAQLFELLFPCEEVREIHFTP